MTIKKNFVELVELLESNSNKKVKDILPEILEMVTSNKKPVTFKKDEDGNITHIFCYYHKEWEPVEWYGKKASSHTGYNTMCKVGVNQWTKQQQLAKKKQVELLDQVANGEVDPSQLTELLAQIDEEKKQIVPRPTDED